MLIGELAKATGLTKDTIRFYEKLGIITGDVKRAGTRFYKNYDAGIIERLRLVRQAKSLGFSLSEIKQLSDEWAVNSKLDAKQKLRVMKKKIAEINEKIVQLNEIKLYLANKVEICEAQLAQGL